MYTSFYNLSKKPFQISSDPSFMWLGEKHKEALATLKYGILDNKGFLLLTGDVGTGKTTLINALLQSLGEDIISTSVPDPGLEKMDFFNFIASAFGIEKEFQTKGSFIAHFRKFLIQANEAGKKVLLIIDEAQLLTQEMLEEIRLLSNIEKMDAKLINIFFVGQNEFNEILHREQNRAVRQRLTLNYNIDPLTPDETAEYIKHRLNVAGAKHQIFDSSAAQEVFLYSGGFPRRINVICDHSLLSGYVKDEKIISSAIVRECAKELKIPAYIRNRDINGFEPISQRPPSVAGKKQVQASPEIKAQQPGVSAEKDKDSQTRSGVFTRTLVVVIIAAAAFFLFSASDLERSIDVLFKNMNAIKTNIIEMLPKSGESKTVNASPRSKIRFKDDKKNAVPLTSSESKPTADNVGRKPVPPSTPGKLIKEIPDRQTDFPENSTDPIESSKNISNTIQHEKDQKTEVKKQVRSENENQVKPQLSEEKVFNQAMSDTMSTAIVSNKSVKSEPPIEKVEKKILPLPKEKVIIRFKYNTNDFTKEEYEKLLTYSEVLAMHPEAKVRVTGYTDSDGYKKYNRKLSEFRANIVRSFLLGRGINPEQVEIRGLGSQNPIESNDTAWGRMMNRRVEIEILK